MRYVLMAVPLLWAACGAKEDESAGSTGMKAAPAGAVDRAKDPVCGMWVEKPAPHRATHEGATYHFCAEECLKKFRAEPATYAAACLCGKTSKTCPCGHCGAQGETCDCA